MKKIVAAVFAVLSFRQLSKPAYPLTRALLFAMILLFPALAFAQQVGGPAPAPMSDTIIKILTVLSILVPVILSVHPFLMLSKWSAAKAEGEESNTVAKIAFNGTASISASVDHFLESGGHDFADLADPNKRVAAIKHIEDAAISGALPALADALEAMGKGWVTGQASQAVDAALAKAPAAAVAAVIEKITPTPAAAVAAAAAAPVPS